MLSVWISFWLLLLVKYISSSKGLASLQCGLEFFCHECCSCNMVCVIYLGVECDVVWDFIVVTLQANKKLELVFVNHTFDVWESWMVDGANLADCSLTNSKFRSVSS